MAHPVIRAALLLTLATPALADETRPRALQSLLDYHAAACTAQGGSLTIPQDAISQVFLLGPEDPTVILDSSKLSCSAAPAMFCADPIGCELNVFMGETQHSLIVQNWSTVLDDDRQLLQVTIAGELLNKPEPGTFLMTWDRVTNGLIEFNQSN